jgi:hypothetical protein
MPDYARIYKADGRTLRINWPSHEAATKVADHKHAFTVIFRQDGKIRREIAGSKPEIQLVQAGIPYSRKGPLNQSVVNLSGSGLDADKDERPPGDQNPDDTIVLPDDEM